jgi:hypothetical protein
MAQRDGQIAGYVVLREMPMKQFSCLAIVDLIAFRNDTETVAALLKCCSQYAKRQKVDFISTVCANHYAFKALMLRKGFIPTKEKFALVVRTPKEGSLVLPASIFKDWFISWFDHDFV